MLQPRENTLSVRYTISYEIFSCSSNIRSVTCRHLIQARVILGAALASRGRFPRQVTRSGNLLASVLSGQRKRNTLSKHLSGGQKEWLCQLLLLEEAANTTAECNSRRAANGKHYTPRCLTLRQIRYSLIKYAG